MSNPIHKFTDRLQNDWLPSFCSAPHRNYPSDGFKHSSIEKLDEFDAKWFMRAIDDDLVSQSDGFFMAPRSTAKEQIFWQGAKNVTPRPITLWVEPVITIGALSRLNHEFGWPIENLGAQSKTWAFDLVCYDTTSDREIVACEVKKDMKEIEKLIKFMNQHCSNPSLESEPINATEKNAYRKVQGIRRSWPTLFWALGPASGGQVFRVSRENDSEQFFLIPTSKEELRYKNA